MNNDNNLTFPWRDWAFGLPAPLYARSIRPKNKNFFLFGLLIVLGLCRPFVGFICLQLMVLFCQRIKFCPNFVEFIWKPFGYSGLVVRRLRTRLPRQSL